MIHIRWADFNPLVSMANRLVCTPGFAFGPRVIDEHQFIFVAEGEGIAAIQGRKYAAKAGDLFYYGPEIAHMFSADKAAPFTVYGLHFAPNRELPASGIRPPVRVLDVDERSYPQPRLNGLTLGEADGEPFRVPEYCSPGVGWVKPYFHQIAGQFNRLDIVAHMHNRALFVQFMLELRRWTGEASAGSAHSGWIAEVKRNLRLHAAEPYSREWLRRWTPYHENYASQLFRGQTGKSPHDYFVGQKVELAKQWLADTEMSVGEIADRLHAGTIHYFSRMFKRHAGCSPSDYRKLQRLI